MSGQTNRPCRRNLDAELKSMMDELDKHDPALLAELEKQHKKQIEKDRQEWPPSRKVQKSDWGTLSFEQAKHLGRDRLISRADAMRDFTFDFHAETCALLFCDEFLPRCWAPAQVVARLENNLWTWSYDDPKYPHNLTRASRTMRAYLKRQNIAFPSGIKLGEIDAIEAVCATAFVCNQIGFRIIFSNNALVYLVHDECVEYDQYMFVYPHKQTI